MKKILITGVAGLLGSRLANWIIENSNYQVIGKRFIWPKYELNKGIYDYWKN